MNQQERKQWAENIAVTGYGIVDDVSIRNIVIARANDEELGELTEDDIDVIVVMVNKINEETRE